MDTPFTPPQFNSTSFNCPHCKAFANMTWDDAYEGYRGMSPISDLRFANCFHCKDYSLWIAGMMIYPSEISVESPNPDLPENIQVDYVEAANILNQSPRGSAALLRLAIDKLTDYLKAKGKDLNAKIADLVANGLSPKIQKALDTVRVVGNNSVHPGQIDLKDNPAIANALFRFSKYYY